MPTPHSPNQTHEESSTQDAQTKAHGRKPHREPLEVSGASIFASQTTFTCQKCKELLVMSRVGQPWNLGVTHARSCRLHQARRCVIIWVVEMHARSFGSSVLLSAHKPLVWCTAVRGVPVQSLSG